MKRFAFLLILLGLALLARSAYWLTVPGFQIETPLEAAAGMHILLTGVATACGYRR